MNAGRTRKDADMSRHAFFTYDDQIYHIANPCGAGLNYQARERVLTPGELTSNV